MNLRQECIYLYYHIYMNYYVCFSSKGFNSVSLILISVFLVIPAALRLMTRLNNSTRHAAHQFIYVLAKQISGGE